MFKKRFKREDKTHVVMKYQNKNSAVVLLYFPCEEKKKLFSFTLKWQFLALNVFWTLWYDSALFSCQFQFLVTSLLHESLTSSLKMQILAAPRGSA